MAVSHLGDIVDLESVMNRSAQRGTRVEICSFSIILEDYGRGSVR